MTGMLLAGVGNVDHRRQKNFLVVDKKTSTQQIEEAFKDFRISEAYNEKKEEGLMSDGPIAGMAKIEIAFNPQPMLHVALAPIKEKIPVPKLKEFETYNTQDLRRATGYLLVKFGAKKSNASGPKTQLERAVEGNLKKLQSKTRRW